MEFQWFSIVDKHWSNDGMVTIHRRSLTLFEKDTASYQHDVYTVQLTLPFRAFSSLHEYSMKKVIWTNQKHPFKPWDTCRAFLHFHFLCFRPMKEQRIDGEESSERLCTRLEQNSLITCCVLANGMQYSWMFSNEHAICWYHCNCLAVPNSSIGYLVCPSVPWSGTTNNQSLHDTIEWP